LKPRPIAVMQEQEAVTQDKRRRHDVRASLQLERFSRHRLRLGGELPAYCTVSITTSPCAAPPAAVAVTVICDVPSTVGAATVTKDDPAVPAAGVAVTVTVAGFGTTA